jgi:hypothetical protein
MCVSAYTYVDRSPAHDDKLLRALHQESREFMAEYLLDLVGLFDLDRHPDRVDRRLDQTAFILAACDHHGVEQ